MVINISCQGPSIPVYRTCPKPPLLPSTLDLQPPTFSPPPLNLPRDTLPFGLYVLSSLVHQPRVGPQCAPLLGPPSSTAPCCILKEVRMAPSSACTHAQILPFLYKPAHKLGLLKLLSLNTNWLQKVAYDSASMTCVLAHSPPATVGPWGPRSGTLLPLR